MNQVLQDEAPATDVRPPSLVPALSWQIGILGGLVFFLYWPILTGLVMQWWQNPNFSHGFFVPLFSAFLIWHERHRLRTFSIKPHWSGLAIAAVAMCILIVGQLGAELFLSRLSLLLLLAGLLVLIFGWALFRNVFFAWAFLLLMIPIPAIIFNQITFPLQLLTSRVAATILPWLGVPILREGNIIILPSMALEVAEACSGIRSLMSLITLAIIYGFLMEKRIWVRWFLAVASVPIAVMANSVRIIGTGLLVQYWDPEKAEGYFHASWGLITFVVALLMLYGCHSLIRLLLRDQEDELPHRSTAHSSTSSRILTTRNLLPKTALAGLLIIGTATLLYARSHNEVFPQRPALKSFPEQFGAWTGIDQPISEDSLQVLGPGDFLLRSYSNQVDQLPPVQLFIAYFPSQKTGDTIHSPKNCLPGAGWTPVESTRIQIAKPNNGSFPATRWVVVRGEDRQLVVYWYLAHDRGVASEYLSKYYLIADSIKMNRSDGSLIRFMTALYPGETADAGEQRIRPFIANIVPQLQYYIPR